MSLRWLPVRPIDWQQVHWAGGESDDAIRLRPEGDGVARCAHRGLVIQADRFPELRCS